ncbi:unnamed protein product [Mycena citricolor]|uniref:N-acetyltransferase domain-containing protein n=1 Tax=Mycena citricolor TaxID=2018698 RepID=A0AAD2HV75_9AGAR|nr:unnamed protein product [Mycena citricolor]
MPGALTTISTSTYTQASLIPLPVWDALCASPQKANTILPVAIKQVAREQNQGPSRRLPDQCWIVVRTNDTIDFVLSVTEGEIGAYPVFVFTAVPTHLLSPEFMYPRLLPLARALFAAVPSTRVYSFFAQDAIARMLSSLWTQITQIGAYQESYYHAKLSFCTRSSFVDGHTTLSSTPNLQFRLRPARANDLTQVAVLCEAFAAGSEPFLLTPEAALLEATTLIQNEQIWVHTIRDRSTNEQGIASLVAFTRNSHACATITKVFTNSRWRRNGCAERLVRHVVKDLLKTKDSVALYVAHDNPAANSVYHRVGFMGLAQGAQPVEGVDSWIEIGMDRSRVVLGHCQYRTVTRSFTNTSSATMAKFPPLTIFDYLHRTVVYSLVGIAGWSVFVGVAGHSGRREARLARAQEVLHWYSMSGVSLPLKQHRFHSGELSNSARRKRRRWLVRRRMPFLPKEFDSEHEQQTVLPQSSVSFNLLFMYSLSARPKKWCK